MAKPIVSRHVVWVAQHHLGDNAQRFVRSRSYRQKIRQYQPINCPRTGLNFLHTRLSDFLANIALAHCDAAGRGIHSVILSENEQMQQHLSRRPGDEPLLV
ncbi:hypothetical protein LJR255_005399 [Pararhizobium sp. LjRoot255]|uniref:hypothetical protein n=1 Tax=Pararhizobium sp. LjRoot255 TaxID=3342298 RepID=UPI003ED0B80A